MNDTTAKRRPVIVVMGAPMGGKSWVNDALRKFAEEGHATVLIVPELGTVQGTRFVALDEYADLTCSNTMTPHTAFPEFIEPTDTRKEKFAQLTAELYRAKAMRNKHLVKELEKRIKRL